MWLIPKSAFSRSVPEAACSMKDLSLDSSCLAFKAGFYVHLSGTPTLRQLSWRGWRIRAWSRFLFGPATLRDADGSGFVDWWIALWRDFPASRGAPPESAKAPTTSGGCGPESLASFRKLNLGFAGSKMSRDLFQPAQNRTSTLCGKLTCLSEFGRRSANKRWQTAPTA